MRFCVFLMAAWLASFSVWSATPEEDLAVYIKIFEGDKSQQLKLEDDLQWMGLSDPVLFDAIEKRLLAEGEMAKYNSTDRPRVAMYITLLGYSGQAKYLPTLEMLTSDEIYAFRGRAQQAVKDVPKYAKWNPIISNRATFDPARSDKVNRLANMLRSDDIGLVAFGGNRLRKGLIQDDFLRGLLEKRVLELHMIAVSAPKAESQNIAEMIESLGSSRLPQYEAMLSQIETNAPNFTISRVAKETLDREYIRPAAEKAALEKYLQRERESQKRPVQEN